MLSLLVGKARSSALFQLCCAVESRQYIGVQHLIGDRQLCLPMIKLWHTKHTKLSVEMLDKMSRLITKMFIYERSERATTSTTISVKV